MSLRVSGVILLLFFSAVQVNVRAEESNEKSEITTKRTTLAIPVLTTMDIVKMLVKEGVLSEQRAEDFIQSVAADKITDDTKTEINKNKSETRLETKVVRVPYIPDYIHKQIRDEVRMELREEVVSDVLAQAKHERWGVPGSLPSWVDRIKFSGDFKLRYQGDFFADQNGIPSNIYVNAQAVNDAGKIGTDPSFFHNIAEDRNRLRARLRFAMNAKVTEGVDVGMRITTGNLNDPVSTNQTLGGSNTPYQLVLDRAYIKIQSQIKEHTFTGGRMPNPWVSTDLIWDKDLNFDGLAYKYRPLQSDDIFDEDRVFDAFVTFGAFPLDEVELSQNDKWLFGFQTGVNWSFDNQDRLDIAIAYYDYTNIEGERNDPDSNLMDYTAPDLLATGNTLFNIANSTTDPNSFLLGLASDYNIVDVLIEYKVASFAPVNVGVAFDYVKNIGYEQKDVLARAGGQGLLAIYGNNDGAARNTGYQLKFKVGWPTLKQRGNWQASMAFKYLERDAVVDLYTDSDFRGGGTDVQGWVIQGKYTIQDNTWLSMKLISADEIDGPPFGQDTVQMDLIASF